MHIIRSFHLDSNIGFNVSWQWRNSLKEQPIFPFLVRDTVLLWFSWHPSYIFITLPLLKLEECSENPLWSRLQRADLRSLIHSVLRQYSFHFFSPAPALEPPVHFVFHLWNEWRRWTGTTYGFRFLLGAFRSAAHNRRCNPRHVTAAQ